MGFLIVLALIVCIISLIVTLNAIGSTDSDYSMGKSFRNLSFIYVIIIPIIVIFFGIGWFLFK